MHNGIHIRLVSLPIDLSLKVPQWGYCHISALDAFLHTYGHSQDNAVVRPAWIRLVGQETCVHCLNMLFAAYPCLADTHSIPNRCLALAGAKLRGCPIFSASIVLLFLPQSSQKQCFPLPWIIQLNPQIVVDSVPIPPHTCFTGRCK